MQEYSEMPKGLKGMKKGLRKKLNRKSYDPNILLFNPKSKDLKILLTNDQVDQLESGQGKLIFELQREDRVSRYNLDKRKLQLTKRDSKKKQPSRSFSKADSRFSQAESVGKQPSRYSQNHSQNYSQNHSQNQSRSKQTQRDTSRFSRQESY